jgi:hypothetical protein
MPFMSRPLGGTPPLAIGVMVSGGNPSVYDAAPGVTAICEGTGIVFAPPASANGTVNFDGAFDSCITNPHKYIVT